MENETNVIEELPMPQPDLGDEDQAITEEEIQRQISVISQNNDLEGEMVAWNAPNNLQGDDKTFSELSNNQGTYDNFAATGVPKDDSPTSVMKFKNKLIATVEELQKMALEQDITPAQAASATQRVAGRLTIDVPRDEALRAARTEFSAGEFGATNAGSVVDLARGANVPVTIGNALATNPDDIKKLFAKQMYIEHGGDKDISDDDLTKATTVSIGEATEIVKMTRDLYTEASTDPNFSLSTATSAILAQLSEDERISDFGADPAADHAKTSIAIDEINRLYADDARAATIRLQERIMENHAYAAETIVDTANNMLNSAFSFPSAFESSIDISQYRPSPALEKTLRYADLKRMERYAKEGKKLPPQDARLYVAQHDSMEEAYSKGPAAFKDYLISSMYRGAAEESDKMKAGILSDYITRLRRMNASGELYTSGKPGDRIIANALEKTYFNMAMKNGEKWALEAMNRKSMLESGKVKIKTNSGDVVMSSRAIAGNEQKAREQKAEAQAAFLDKDFNNAASKSLVLNGELVYDGSDARAAVIAHNNMDMGPEARTATSRLAIKGDKQVAVMDSFMKSVNSAFFLASTTSGQDKPNELDEISKSSLGKMIVDDIRSSTRLSNFYSSASIAVKKALIMDGARRMADRSANEIAQSVKDMFVSPTNSLGSIYGANPLQSIVSDLKKYNADYVKFGSSAETVAIYNRLTKARGVIKNHKNWMNQRNELDISLFGSPVSPSLPDSEPLMDEFYKRLNMIDELLTGKYSILEIKDKPNKPSGNVYGPYFRY